MDRYYKNTLTASIEQHLPKKAFYFDESQIESLKNAGQIVLALAAAAGVVAVSVIAPNALKLFKSVPAIRRSLRKSNRPAKRVAETFYYLKRQGYVKLIQQGSEVLVELTEAGHKRLLVMNFQNPKISKQTKWDGKWWFVLADIPTKEHRNQANVLRRKIRRLGLYPLQRSVWVYPYNPKDQIAFICGYLHIDRFVTVLRADNIEADDQERLVKHFKNII
jgi:hypothetical protein